MKILAKAGWTESRHKGGHALLKRRDGTGRVIVPDHPGDLKDGTLRGILRQAGLTLEQFNELRRS